jgi:uncharacterized ion transporter superfamily protein YfcC
VSGPQLRLPHPLILLLGCLLAAAVLSHVLPAGHYERRDDPVTGRSIVVPGTYHEVPPQPVGVFQALVAVPKGLVDAASVVFLVFLVGGAFAVVEQTGALADAVGWLARRLANRETLVIPITTLAFALGGITENMQEEIIAFVPILLVLTRRLGFDPLTAAAVSLGGAAVGSAFSPINPFQVIIGQKLAQLPVYSGWAFRTVFLAVALGIWIWGTVRYTRRNRIDRETVAPDHAAAATGARPAIVLALVLVAFTLLVVGTLKLGWGFDELSAVFFTMGLIAGLVAGLGLSGTAEAFINGFRSMAGAAMFVGFARSIYVALDEGQILDTIVHGIFTPLAHIPLTASAIGMALAHTVIHVPVPSVSGQAVLTIPILVPVSDLLGLSRQVTVLALQYGAGLCEIITPTNGAMMAILAAAGVPFGKWLRFVLPLWAGLLGLGVVAIVIGIATGLR